MNALDLVLIQAAASYSPPEPKTSEPKTPRVKLEPIQGPKRPPGRPRKNPANQAPANQAEASIKEEKPNNSPKGENPLKGIEVGSLKAADFLVALHKAGKQDPNQYTWDRIKAIHGFCGYHFDQAFGVQLDNAERRAKAIVHGVIADKPRPSISVKGFVSGMPDMVAKKRGDLEGRIEKACQDREAFLKAAERDLAEGKDPSTNKAWASLEEKRIENLTKQLEELGF